MKCPFILGGTVAANARACADSWPRVLNVLQLHPAGAKNEGRALGSCAQQKNGADESVPSSAPLNSLLGSRTAFAPVGDDAYELRSAMRSSSPRPAAETPLMASPNPREMRAKASGSL